ncbi:unnamed protein product [Notodromas monacha]|uniref:SERTA domain-containing protein n=1 Tax=Notodromas monacha TaxID=399045 RepID=A0A7R9BRC8_9CRUS|nr:unnamed protein product [Notodromas monacha]CAG0920283.1 unnamed protein product [Notodromas monacha]
MTGETWTMEDAGTSGKWTPSSVPATAAPPSPVTFVHHHNHNHHNHHHHHHQQQQNNHQQQQQNHHHHHQQTTNKRFEEGGKSYLELGSCNFRPTPPPQPVVAPPPPTPPPPPPQPQHQLSVVPLRVEPRPAPPSHRQSPYSHQRLIVLNMSMCKLNKYLSLHKSVLICNTMRSIEKEMEQEGVRLGGAGAPVAPPLVEPLPAPPSPMPVASECWPAPNHNNHHHHHHHHPHHNHHHPHHHHHHHHHLHQMEQQHQQDGVDCWGGVMVDPVPKSEGIFAEDFRHFMQVLVET